MAILRGLLVLFVLYGIFLSGNTQNVTDETTVAEDTTTEAVTSVATETSTAMEADTTVSTTTVTVAMVTNETTTAMMTTTTEPETDQTTMETTTMYIPMTTLAPITSTNCTRDENCTALDSICNTTIGVCQCKDDFVLVNDTICSTVDAFKVTIRFENITDNSIIVNWETLDISGVDVNYEIMFNSSMATNISSPPYLMKNLSDGEVHSVLVKSIVKGRDDRVSFTQSDMKFVRTAPSTPVFNNTIDFIAPNVTIMWTPRNPDVDLYYIYLKGHDTMSIPSSTNETSLTLTDLKPGRNYMLTVIQQTGGPYASNSSEAILNIRTQSTEPGPPEAVEVVDIGQRNISINVTDTGMPNGDITGYRLLIMYKLYPDEMKYMVKMDFLKKTMSNIYVIKGHIYPGAEYRITVFTVNDAFNSSLNSTLQEITTLPDTPGQVDRPSNINQTTTSAVITWHRPLHPNGNMKAYRAVLESGPEISNCRIYYLCVDACNNTILGPPNNTCTISNDTSLMENQKIMYLLVDNLRIGTTYTLSVVGYNEAGEGKTPQSISLTTKSIRPDPVDVGTFYINTSRRIVTWTPPAFAGEDLKYSVTFKDAFFGTIAGNTEETAAPTYNLPNNLHYYYNYTVVVTAKTSNGSANPSQQTFTTPYGGKLGAPQKIKIKNDDCEKILITWFEPAIRARNGPITGYQFTNTLGNQKWDYGIIGPEYWATQNKQFSYELPISENTVYSIEIHAVSSITNQEGNSYGTKRFQSIQCPVDNTPEIVLIVFAFLILLGICLAVIIYVYRKKVREIEETYINNPPRPAPGERGLTPIVDEEIELNRPFILSDAQKAFEEKSADSYRLFLMEYDDIKKLSQIEGRKRTTNAANIDANKAKNRYVNILSYDHSRVKLRMIDDDPCSDYVNANYIIGYTYEREYIASQGPLPGTVNDFWRMTWEQSVTIIVMLTKCKEGNTDKCEHYWPDTVNEPKQYGDIVVNLISVSNMDKFDINIFQVSQGDYTRTIKHFHFLEWPDFSAAVDSTVVIDFIQTVRTHITPEVKGPLLIHCSAGVGRTGTYISIDYLLQFVRDHDLGQPVDIFAWVVQMRKNRVSMVQVDKQYIFIHRALTELIDRKRNGLLQSQDDTTILNEIVYENTAFQSDDDEEEEEEEDEDEESDAMYENSMKKVPDQHITEL